MGDVEKYFEHIQSIHNANSGNNDYRMTAQDSYQISVPIHAGQFTRFRLTDSSMDIVDISQGYLNLKCKLDYNFLVQLNDDKTASNYDWEWNRLGTDNTRVVTTHGRNGCYFFLGFKSGSQIIKSYNVYSNGRPTACKQLRSIYEQTITYSSKSKEERAGRPGMYSVPNDILKMRDCVCGVYIQQPEKLTGPTSEDFTVEMDICIQIDDLLPFSAMSYFPQFACGELELEIMCELERNMVWCQIPYEEVVRARPFMSGDEPNIRDEVTKMYATKTAGDWTVTKNSIVPIIRSMYDEEDWYYFKSKNFIDTRLHQCGDYARCIIGLTNFGGSGSGHNYDINITDTSLALWKKNKTLKARFCDCHCTIIPKNLVITEAKSYIFGFNLKEEAKRNCMAIFEKNGNLTIPAQWIEYMNPAQTVNPSSVKITTTMPLWQCGQLVFTFPNSANQLTVSRNPYLKALRCQIGNKLIPDKNMTTLDKAHSEMILTALGFDSMFSAPKSLLTALGNKNQYARKFYPKHDDDSDYMFVCDLERNGNSVYHDGLSGDNVPILFDAEFINETDNPHYYEYDPQFHGGDHYQLRKQSINIFAVEDAYWVFGREGGEFIKDFKAVAITKQLEH